MANKTDLELFKEEYLSVVQILMKLADPTFLFGEVGRGSGKTTLLKVIAGFEESSDGKIEINGEDIAEKKAYERNRI